MKRSEESRKEIKLARRYTFFSYLLKAEWGGEKVSRGVEKRVEMGRFYFYYRVESDYISIFMFCAIFINDFLRFMPIFFQII